MIWGFTHVRLTDEVAEITMLSTPNNGSGEVIKDDQADWRRLLARQ